MMNFRDALGFRLAPRPKVMGVGWAKTGTTSLGAAFRHFSFRHVTMRTDAMDMYCDGDLQGLMRIACCYDSFEDWPWLLMWKEFDQAFPGMKFVLTVRNSSSWLRSYLNQITQPGHDTPIMNERRKVFYGLDFPSPNHQTLVARYERHNQEVSDYFKDRPGDLLVVDWSKGDGWAQLAPFLGKVIPDLPFPHSNRGLYRTADLTDSVSER